MDARHEMALMDYKIRRRNKTELYKRSSVKKKQEIKIIRNARVRKYNWVENKVQTMSTSQN